MRNIVNFSLPFLIFCIGQSIAQHNLKLSVSESEVYQDEVGIDSISSIYTSKSGKTGILRNSKNSVIFDLFDTNLNKLATQEIKLERKEQYIGDIFYANELKVFTEEYPKKDIKVLSCHIFNYETNSHKKIELSTETIDRKLSLYSNKKDAAAAVSPNGKYLAVASYTIHRDQLYMHLKIFDAETLKILNQNQVVRKENIFYSLKAIDVDDGMNVYIMGESYYSSEDPKSKLYRNLNFLVEKYTGKDHQVIEITIDQHILLSAKPYIINDRYTLYGLYSDIEDNRIVGVCTIGIEMFDFKPIFQNLYEFPEMIYTDLFGSDNLDKRKSEGLHHFATNYIAKDNDNNIYLTAEQYYIGKDNNLRLNGSFRMIGNRKNSGENERFDDIIVFRFNENGELDWGRGIFKRDRIPSYNVFLKNNTFHVILNSGKRLQKLDDGRTRTSQGLLESSSLYDFVYDKEGEVTIQKIQNNLNNTYYLPNFGTYVNDKFIMISDSSRHRQFMTLK